MEISDEAYQGHSAFQDLTLFADFYESLAHAVMSFILVGTTGIVNVNTYVYSSVQGTLSSIEAVLRAGRLNDAYALLRKYLDSVFINLYADLFLKENYSIENFVVSQIDNWIKGKEALPEFRKLSEFVRGAEAIRPVTKILFADKRYKKLRHRCNEHAHYNYFYHLVLNDSAMPLRNRSRLLDQFATDLRDVFILHIGCLFVINQHYMMAHDYIDHIEFGSEPPDGSEDWVAPFAQKIFTEVISRWRPDLAAEIREVTTLELE